MKVQLRKDKVINSSVWLIGSVVDLPDEEAQKLIDCNEAIAEELSEQPAAVSEEQPIAPKAKKKAK